MNRRGAGEESLESTDRARTLATLRALVVENRPSREGYVITPHSRLSEDLYLDSLARVELIRRLERALGRDIQERAVFEARTVGALIEAACEAPLSEPALSTLAHDSSGARVVQFPPAARSVVEALDWHVQTQPSTLHVRYLGETGTEELTYEQFFLLSIAAADQLTAAGLRRGDRFGIMLPTSIELLALYMAGLIMGAVPVPLYPPASMDRIEEHLGRQTRILNNAGVSLLVLPREGRILSPLLRASVPTLRTVFFSDQLVRGGEGVAHSTAVKMPQSSDLAFLQYTSGSTGQPKGVMLSHQNLVENIRAMTEVLALRSDDVCVSWLPLYHDMGLIGAWLGSLTTGVPLVLMSPLSFLARPARWLRTISDARGTISAGPNFAFELCAERVLAGDCEGLDLSSWRIALNGAEPVNPRTLERFVGRFSAYGFKASAMRPVYGLAENALGVLFPRHDSPPRIVSADRAILQTEGRLEQVERSDSSVELVSCGSPIPRHDVRIVDPFSREVSEGQVGMLQFSGPSATEGYFNNPQATAKLVVGPWRVSGDLALRWGEDFFIVGREKDLIIRAGRNIAPHDVEEAAAQVVGVRRGCVAAFAVEGKSGEEQLVVVAETRELDRSKRAAIQAEIMGAVSRHLDVTPDTVVLVAPRTIPKTSSGKLRRSDCRERFMNDRLLPQSGRWPQMLRLLAGSLPAMLKRLRAEGVQAIYAAWCWGVYAVCSAVGLCVVVAVPTPQGRRRALRALARGLLRVSGIPLLVDGLENIPDRGAIIVSNHQSYVDAVILTAVLPARCRFVAKRDFINAGFFEWMFSRLETLFVERSAVEQSQEDLGAIVDALKRGAVLVYFPEGGFWRDRESLPFKTGAFAAAAEAQVPAVPLALSGTRELLREGTWMPKWASISVNVKVPHPAPSPEWREIVALRNRVEGEVREMLERARPR